MSTLITIDELEREVLYLREQNQKILRELSTVIEDNSVLRKKLRISTECRNNRYPNLGVADCGRIEQTGDIPELGILRLSTSLN